MSLALFKSSSKSDSGSKGGQSKGSASRGMFWLAAIALAPVAIWFWAPFTERASGALAGQGVELTGEHMTLINLLGLPALALLLALAAGAGGWKYLPKTSSARWAASLGWFCWVFALNAAFIAWISSNF